MSVLGKIGQWKSLAKEAVERALIFGKFLCFLHITDNYICSPIIVHGPSMLPTMNLTGDVVLAEHISPRLGHLGTGDIVLVRSPENPRKTVTKRILGMEGDKVTFLVDPNYDSGHYRSIVVPKGHVWIQGITFTHLMILGTMGLFLMVLLMAKCGLDYGLLMGLDHWDNKQNKTVL